MTRQDFIEFSLEKEESIDRMIDLFYLQGWKFYWDYLKSIIIKNNISVIRIIEILNTFGSHDKISINKYQFIEFICREQNKGYDPDQVNDNYYETFIYEQ